MREPSCDTKTRPATYSPSSILQPCLRGKPALQTVCYVGCEPVLTQSQETLGE